MVDTFCSKIFLHEETTSIAPVKTINCCLLPRDVDIPKVRRELLSGKRAVECQQCWNLEDQGIESDRMIKNRTLDFYLDRDISLIEEDCRQGKFSTKILKMEVSNLCNGTCVTCDPASSTAWATLRKQKTFNIIDQKELDSFDFSNLVMLSFVGGEPLYEKKVFSILEHMLEIGNDACLIDFVTNGSVTLSQKQIEILSKFKNNKMTLSIDGIGPRFEYMRYPLTWERLLSNIELFNQLGIELSVSYTISNVNIMYYNETVKWFNQQGLPHNTNLVKFPSYFSPHCLPMEIKKQIDIPFVDSNNHTNAHDEQFRVACQEIREQDKLKKINIKDYMPEFYNIME